MKSSMHIGADVKRGTVKEINKQILKILHTEAGDEVKKAALSALTINLKTENVAVNSCSFGLPTKKKGK